MWLFVLCCLIFFFKQKTAYEMRISDWSSDVCSSDLPRAFATDALAQPESRSRFRALMNLGYTDALRALHRTPHLYTFWDYQGGGWQHDKGLRIDHFLLSPQAADLLESCEIDRGPRGEPKASDHTPVVCRLRDPAAARVAA